MNEMLMPSSLTYINYRIVLSQGDAASAPSAQSATRAELKLERPETVKQGSHYGVRIRAGAPSLHLIRANVNTEISPLVGTEKQSEEMAQYLTQAMEDDPDGVWDTNMFGKTLSAMVGDELNGKLGHMPQEAREKVSELLERIMNEGSGSMICILL